MIIVIIILIILFAGLYLLSTSGRKGHPGLPELRNRYYAHRGLHSEGIPENSMAAFRAAKKRGFGIELDVHLTADGKLAVIHDSSLKRITGEDGIVEDMTYDQLQNFWLDGTLSQIPEFSQVLDLFAGEAPLIVELKVYRNNVKELCGKVCEYLDDYRGPFCVESFDPRCVRWFRKNRPDMIRGQLTENFFKSTDTKLAWPLKFILRHQMLNFYTKPDFIAYRYKDIRTISNVLTRKLWKLQGVTWTLISKEELEDAVQQEWIPIFEGFIPEE